MISRSKILCVVSQEALQDISGTSYKWYLQVVSFQQSSDVHKKCKIQASTIYPKMHTFASMRSTPFMKLMTKGERLYKDMKALRLRLYKVER